MKYLKDMRGYTLAELVAVLPMGLIIIAALTVGILHFVKTYQEITMYSELQKETMNTIEVIKYGYPKSPITDNKILIGLSNAYQINFPNSTVHNSAYSEIIIKPVDPNSENGITDSYARYYLNRNNELMLTANYNGRMFREKIFPKENKKIGRFWQYEIINKDLFYDVTPNPQSGLVMLIKIHLKTRVRLRKKGKDQNTDEDIKLNTKTVDFETVIYASNVRKIEQ